MRNDFQQNYMMPLIIGPIQSRETAGAVYNEVEIVSLQYQTSSEAIAALLPDCYRPAENPIVTVAFVYNDDVEFMAGRGYRLATVMVAARYDGERDHAAGNYVLVMFEDDTLPIILGRERLGVPKLYADISPIRTLPDGHLHCEASLWGNMLFGLDIGPLTEQNNSVISAANEEPRGLPMFGYKYIPSIEDGPPDAAYPISTPSDSRLEQLWLGRSGHFFLGDPKYEDITFLASIIDALKTLPLHEVVGVTRSRGSSILRTDLSRRLR